MRLFLPTSHIGLMLLVGGTSLTWFGWTMYLGEPANANGPAF